MAARTIAVERMVEVETAGSDGRPTTERLPLSKLQHDPRCVVLLGDPGMGKTTELKAAERAITGGTYRPVRIFVAGASARVCAGATLLLDALDEAMAVSANDPLAAVAARLHEAGLPRFWLSCRVVDWAGQGGAALLSECAPAGLVVARLLPLSDAQIAALAQAKGVAGADLLDAMREAGLEPLLRNPFTLNLVLDVAGEGGLPTSRWELFERAVELLTRERRDRIRTGLVAPVTTAGLLDAAGAVCAALLISGEGAVATGADGVQAAAAVAFAPVAPVPSVEAALRTRLFAAAGEERWEPQHRVVAEFLGARFLADRVGNHGLPLQRVVALLRGSAEAPHPSLRGLFAWLVTLLPQHAEELVRIDPYGVVSYGDPTRLPPAARRALLAALGELAEREPWFRAQRWGEARLGALAVPELVEDLRGVLAERPARPHLLSCACDALEQGEPRPELRRDLEALLTDASVPADVRLYAVPAYLRATAAAPDAAPALFRRLLAEPALDPDLQVTGGLFLELYPSQLEPEDAVSVLRRHAETDGENDALHLDHRLPDLVPAGAEADLLDALSACTWAVQEADPRSRPTDVQQVAGALAARAILRPDVDAARILGWSKLLWAHFARGHDREAVGEAFGARPDLFVPLLLGATEALAPLEVMRTPHAVAAAVHQALPLLPWPEDAPERLLAAARGEADPARASRLFAAALTAFQRRPRPGVGWFEAAWFLGRERPDLSPVLDAACAPVEIPEMRREPAKEAGRARAARAARQAAHVGEMERRDAGIRDGTDLGALTWLAQRWFAEASIERDLNLLPHRERLRAVVGEAATAAAEQGFRALAERGQIPCPAELAEQAVRNRWLNFAVLAGGDLLSSDAREGLPPLPPERLTSLLCLALAMPTRTRVENTLCQDRRPWIGKIASALPEEGARAVERLIAPQLAAAEDNNHHVQGLDEVCGDEALAPIRSIVVPDLLRVARHAHAVQRLIAAALKMSPREEVYDIVLGRLRRARPGPLAERWPWLHAAWRLDPVEHEDEVRRALATDPSLHVKLADATGETIAGHDAFPVPLGSAHRRLILQVFGPRHPPIRLMGGFGIPDRYQLGRLVGVQLDHLSAIADEAAHRMLVEAASDPAFVAHREHALQRLATWRREADLRGWERPAVAAVAAALRKGPPASAADLVAFVEDHLRQLNAGMRTTEANPWHEFWNLDRGTPTGPRLENDSRDGVVRLLQSRFERAGVAQATEARRAGDDRCDIVAAALGRNLPVEVKCDWHDELWTAWKDQLAARYACHPGAAGRGIYLVLWFGPGRGEGRRVKPAPDGTTPTSAAELEEKLAAVVAESGLPMRVVALDVTPTKPVRETVPRSRKKTKARGTAEKGEAP